MSGIAPSPFNRAYAEKFARVTGSSTAASVAIYTVPPVAALIAYKVAGGGAVGFIAGVVAAPVAFIALGTFMVWKYGPGSGS